MCLLYYFIVLFSLKAEWLYSQGRGRSFRPGEQRALVEYLINVCPIKPQNDEGEDFKKLKLILSKAQQHQKQLRDQLSTGVINLLINICLNYLKNKNKKFYIKHSSMIVCNIFLGQETYPVRIFTRHLGRRS